MAELIRSEFDYLFCFDTNIQKLQTQLRDLKATREVVQLWVVEARNNLRSVPEADTWQIEANNKIAEADTIIESEARVQTGCLNGWCGPRYSLSRKAANITPDLVHLHTEGIKCTQLSHSPPPPSIQALPSTGFKWFESRNLIVKQIIEALKDDEINLVGLCGMGGVGKRTMVKHVAKRVEEEKLFNEVDLNIENYEELFGVANPFGNDGIDSLFGVKEMSSADLNSQGCAAEGSSIGLVSAMQPDCSTTASANSVKSSKTESNLCYARQQSNLSFSGITGESGAGDYQDSGASSMLLMGEPSWCSPYPKSSCPSTSRSSAILRYKEKKKTRNYQSEEVGEGEVLIGRY